MKGPALTVIFFLDNELFWANNVSEPAGAGVVAAVQQSEEQGPLGLGSMQPGPFSLLKHTLCVESPVLRCCCPEPTVWPEGTALPGASPDSPASGGATCQGGRAAGAGDRADARSRAVARAVHCSPGGDGSAGVLLQTCPWCPRLGATMHLRALGRQLIFV